MKRSILFIIILFVTFSARSQVIWSSGFVTSLEEYIFIPTEFDHFGKWLADIEKDTTLISKKKEFTLEGDSLYLNFDLVKPGFSSPFNNSALSVIILGTTRQFDNLKEIIKKDPASIDVKRLPSQKVITIYIGSKISFDSTNEGKLLASQAMEQLEVEFSRYFENKKSHQISQKYSQAETSPGSRKTSAFLHERESYCQILD